MVTKEHPDYIIAAFALEEYISGKIKLDELATMHSVFPITCSMAFSCYFAQLFPQSDPVA